jgi:hypothetical protein
MVPGGPDTFNIRAVIHYKLPFGTERLTYASYGAPQQLSIEIVYRTINNCSLTSALLSINSGDGAASGYPPPRKARRRNAGRAT